MSALSNSIEELLKAPLKTLETLLPQATSLKNLLSFKYDDSPMDEKVYGRHTAWLRLFHDYYFQVEHIGHFEEVSDIAKREKGILISNHANTLEAPLLCYYFYIHGLGVVNPMVFKEAFRLPIVREFFRSGQSIPISVPAGKEALKKNHILVFPEGMDFIKHYLKPDFVVKFHKGFLYMAREHLRETGKESMYVFPVAHDGIDHTVKFWVINNPFLVENFIKPLLHYPYFVFPKAPFVFPTHAVFNWGRPRELKRQDLKDEKSIGRWADEFRHEIVRLRHRARTVRKMEKKEMPSAHQKSDLST